MRGSDPENGTFPLRTADVAAATTHSTVSQTNLLVLFRHPLVPVVQHLQPFGLPLPQHLDRDVFSAADTKDVQEGIRGGDFFKNKTQTASSLPLRAQQTPSTRPPPMSRPTTETIRADVHDTRARVTRVELKLQVWGTEAAKGPVNALKRDHRSRAASTTPMRSRLDFSEVSWCQLARAAHLHKPT